METVSLQQMINTTIGNGQQTEYGGITSSNTFNYTKNSDFQFFIPVQLLISYFCLIMEAHVVCVPSHTIIYSETNFLTTNWQLPCVTDGLHIFTAIQSLGTSFFYPKDVRNMNSYSHVSIRRWFHGILYAFKEYYLHIGLHFPKSHKWTRKAYIFNTCVCVALYFCFSSFYLTQENFILSD